MRVHEQIEEALRASEAFNTSIIRSSNDCIKVLDAEGRLEFMSDGGQRQLNVRDVNQLLGSPYQDFWKGSDREAVRQAMDEARAGRTGRFRGFCPTCDGEPKWWDVLVSPIGGPECPTGKLLVVSRDVTELKRYEDELRGARDHLELRVSQRTAELAEANRRLESEVAQQRRAEEALRQSEEQYRSILEHAADGIFVLTAERRFIEANPEGCAMLGYSRDELLTMRLDDLLPPEQLADNAPICRHIALGSSFTEEQRIIRRDGRPVDGEIKGTRLLDGRLLIVARDVTERKRARAEQAATERMISLGRLAQSVGHEINNPLAYLTLSHELLRPLVSDFPPERRKEFDLALSSAEDAAARIGHVVRALSAFGRGDIESVGPVSLMRAVDAAVVLTKNRVQHAGAIHVALAETPLVHANEFGLTQVIVNLLLNAADAMECTTRATHAVSIASLVAPDGRIVLEVSDTGLGIPPADLERIFDPFYTTKAIGKGTGVGLAISRSIVASFGGKLEAENRRAGGATFRVVLAPANAPPAVVERAAPMPAVTGLRVLVVDDEPLIGKTIALLLDKHEVVVCSSIAAALEACREADFDCILCDLMMPHGNGAEFYEALERHKPALLPKIVFMTGGAFTKASAQFVERTPNRCLTKPLSSAALREAIEETARR